MIIFPIRVPSGSKQCTPSPAEVHKRSSVSNLNPSKRPISAVADNFDESATFNDGSCTYPDNGDYSLSFDGVDDWIEIPHSSTLDLSGNEMSIIIKTKVNGSPTVNGSPCDHTSIFSKTNSHFSALVSGLAVDR